MDPTTAFLYAGKLFSLFIGIFSIGFLIAIHEGGHYIFCKLFSVPAPRFAVGVGPIIYKKRKWKTLFTIGVIPIAGYVQIGNTKDIAGDELAIFCQRRPWYQGVGVILGGIVCNILFAYLILIGLSLYQSTHDTSFQKFRTLEKLTISLDSEKNETEVVLCQGKPFTTYQEFLSLITPGGEITLLHENTPTPLIYEPTMAEKITLYFKQLSFIEKIAEGITIGNKIIVLTVQSLCSLCSRKNIEKVSGPIGIIQHSINFLHRGFASFLFFMALMSIGVALMNCVPLPVFDGGQLVMFLLRRLFNNSLPARLQKWIMYGSFLFLILLTIYVTKNDIIHLMESMKRNFVATNHRDNK